jgi:hypothetical protein
MVAMMGKLRDRIATDLGPNAPDLLRNDAFRDSTVATLKGAYSQPHAHIRRTA